MMRNEKEKGYIMFEVMILIMIFLMVSSALLASASSDHRRAVESVRKEEAYCAALSAVRVMAEEVMENEGESGTLSEIFLSGRGMKKKTTEIVFESDERTEVSIPVTVWTRKDGDEVIIYAKAAIGEYSETVSVTMKYSDMWIPVMYGIE